MYVERLKAEVLEPFMIRGWRRVLEMDRCRDEDVNEY
jgi:hypothetical protein